MLGFVLAKLNLFVFAHLQFELLVLVQALEKMKLFIALFLSVVLPL